MSDDARKTTGRDLTADEGDRLVAEEIANLAVQDRTEGRAP